MSLPFLPLCPTGMMAPASTAREEALGQPDMAIIRNILANIRAGDEEGAQEEACRAVDSWLATAKLHSRELKGWVVPDEELWAKLVDNVFPNAPRPPATLNPPVTNRERFYEMCQRYRDLREFRETPGAQQLIAFKEAQEASWEQFRKLRAIPGNNPVRERRRDAWKRAKLRAYRLYQALPNDVDGGLYHRLNLLKKRITEWNPDPMLCYSDVDNGEYGEDPEVEGDLAEVTFYHEYNGNPPWLPETPPLCLW